MFHKIYKFNYGMWKKDMFGQKYIIYCTFPMDLVGFSTLQQTWAIFHNTRNLPKI